MSRDEALTEMIRIEEEVNRDYYAGMTRGRIEERERIIKLIENPLHHNIQSPDIHVNCYTCILLKTIIGEAE